MGGFVRLALSRPHTFVVMSILILIFGAMAIVRTPTDILPTIGIPVISVVWNYAGLPPEEMSGRIISVYERSVTTTVNGLEHLESQSLPGFGIVKIYFQPTTNINAAQAQIAAISQTILKSLPQGTTPPLMLVYNITTVPVIQLALSSRTLSQTALNDIAQNFIRPSLSTVPGAQLPTVYGGTVRQIQIDLDASALRAHGLSAADIGDALAHQNAITPVGTEKIGPYEWIVDLNGSPKRIEAFNDLPIKAVNGAVVYMRDVAYVHNGSPPQTNIVQLDGQKGVLMSVLKTGSVSVLDIIEGVKARIPFIQETLPPGVNLRFVADQSVFVRSSVMAVVREGVIAAALTATMILMFLGSWRSTLIIVVSIPLAVLCALAALSVLDQTFNVMTLGGLALAVGILVDDATVTIENINRRLETYGEDVVTAITVGAQEIMPPATIALFCICIAFVPLMTLGGVVGYLLRPLAMAVVFAMIASYVLTYTVVPTLAHRLLRRHQTNAAPDATMHVARMSFFHRVQMRFEAGFDGLRRAYLGTLAVAVEHRTMSMVAFVLMMVTSLTLVPSLGREFFPSVEADSLRIHIRAPTGTRIEEMTLLVDRVEGKVRSIVPPQELVSVVNNIGLPVSAINISYGNSGTIGIFDADMLVTLKPGRTQASAYLHILRSELSALFPGTTFSFLPADIVSQILNFGVPSPVDVQVVGVNADANRAFASKLLDKMRHVPGIADPRIQEQTRNPALRVDFDRDLAGVVGLTEVDAAKSMQTTLSGSTQTAPTYWLDPKNGVSYPVSVQSPQYAIDTIGALEGLPLTPATTTQLLGGFSKISPVSLDAVVDHYDIKAAVNIFATNQARDLGAVVDDVQALIDQSKTTIPKGSTVTIRGQATTMASAYRQLAFGLGFSIVLIYLILVVNFQSWVDPLIIITALPAALAGIVWILFVTKTSISVPAMTGAIMCMGVATANSILVVSFARGALRDGRNAVEAAIQAGAVRLRPVIMTALAMIIGMVPMAIEQGQNAPLGRAVIGGLLFATVATLLFVPLVFSLVHGGRRPPSLAVST